MTCLRIIWLLFAVPTVLLASFAMTVFAASVFPPLACVVFPVSLVIGFKLV